MVGLAILHGIIAVNRGWRVHFRGSCLGIVRVREAMGRHDDTDYLGGRLKVDMKPLRNRLKKAKGVMKEEEREIETRERTKRGTSFITEIIPKLTRLYCALGSPPTKGIFVAFLP